MISDHRGLDSLGVSSTDLLLDSAPGKYSKPAPNEHAFKHSMLLKLSEEPHE